MLKYLRTLLLVNITVFSESAHFTDTVVSSLWTILISFDQPRDIISNMTRVTTV
jgi:hypothetical protein